MRFLLTVIVYLISLRLYASEAYIVRFSSEGKPSGCVHARWLGDAHLYNPSMAPVVVHLLGISNGALPPGTIDSLTLPPQQVVSITSARAGWTPTGTPSDGDFFVLHLDVPENVAIDNRDEVVMINDCIQGQPRLPIVKVPLPVMRSLVPANATQVILGTDVGTSTARQNVAVYNGGNAVANAHIEVRRSCDNGVVDERTFNLSPNTLVQVNGLTLGEGGCSDGMLQSYARYTIVRVDQPSFSLVSTISEPQPDSTGIVPRVELSVATAITYY